VGLQLLDFIGDRSDQGLNYIVDFVLGGILSAIPGVLAGAVATLPQWIILTLVGNQRTSRSVRSIDIGTMVRLAASWVIASFVALSVGMVTNFSYVFELNHTLLELMLWSIPGGFIGGLIFAWLSLIAVDR